MSKFFRKSGGLIKSFTIVSQNDENKHEKFAPFAKTKVFVV